MIVEETTLDDPPLVDVGVDNLWLVPSGPLPPNPADILGSRRMEQVIAALKARADVILFDAPPVVSVTDATVLGTKVDGVLLAVCAGRTRREHAQRAKELLERVHVRIIGAVLNDAPRGVVLGGY
jgi:non-specific protein-tyrosine kinase